MTKDILIDNIKKYLDKEGYDYTKVEIINIYNAFIEVLHEELEDTAELVDVGNSINLAIPLLGKFKIIQQESYFGINPLTGKKIKIKPTKKIYFSPYIDLKRAINRKY